MVSLIQKIRRLHFLSEVLRGPNANYQDAKDYQDLMKELQPLDITGILLNEIDNALSLARMLTERMYGAEKEVLRLRTILEKHGWYEK